MSRQAQTLRMVGVSNSHSCSTGGTYPRVAHACLNVATGCDKTIFSFRNWSYWDGGFYAPFEYVEGACAELLVAFRMPGCMLQQLSSSVVSDVESGAFHPGHSYRTCSQRLY